MEKQLVSFGNYLLKKCKVKGHDLDGDPVFDRLVTDADLCNWKEEEGKEFGRMLPSRFQLGDVVSVRFKDFTISKAYVIKVHFTESKVLYDLNVCILGDGGDTLTTTRIYNVDSAIIEEFSK